MSVATAGAAECAPGESLADAEGQPAPAQLPAAFLVASSAVPVSAGTLRSVHRPQELNECFPANSPGPSRPASRPSRSRAVPTESSAPPPAAASSGGSAAAPRQQRPAGGLGSGGGGSNARSGPAAGGASGTVGSVSTSGFTMTTSAGQKVTVDEASSTTYEKGTSPASASAVTTGEPVLVLGTTSDDHHGDAGHRERSTSRLPRPPR